MDSYKYRRRARRPRLSHGSLDRQPNDHLGRSCFRPQLFEHRRQILRGRVESNTNAYTNSNGHSHVDANADRDSNCDAHRNSNTDRNCNANTYTDADPMRGEMFTHTEAAPQCQCATHSAPSFNTAAYRFTERDRGSAAHSAATPHTTADAYRLAAPNSGTAAVSGRVVSDITGDE